MNIKPVIAEYMLEPAQEDSLLSLRTIILFGRNSSTYKFALVHALLSLSKGQTRLRFGDLQKPFMKELVRHFSSVPHQHNTGKANKMGLAIERYLASDKSDHAWDVLMNETSGTWHNYVFDKLHNVGGGEMQKQWKLYDHNKAQKEVVLTDVLMTILDDPQALSLMSKETQARWTAIETAWAAGLSSNLVTINNDTNELVIESRDTQRRVNLRSAVDTLLPYQKGKCFYCEEGVSTVVDTDDDYFADVDHFFPHSFIKKQQDASDANHFLKSVNRNGIWNLVIACRSCNRGKGGKSDARPDDSFLPKLIKRNKLFTEEHRHAVKTGVLETLGVSRVGAMEKKIRKIWRLCEPLTAWKPRKLSS